MIRDSRKLSRRGFVTGALSAASLASIASAEPSASKSRRIGNKFCAFVKFIQSLSYDEMAKTIAEAGFDGIEATVRTGGQIPPESVEQELPKLVESLKKQNLEIIVMASDVNRVDQPLTQKVLHTAAALGIERYRMKPYRYDLAKPVLAQLDEIRPVLKELIALNRELGISAVYQNHSGSRNVGAVLWDLHHLIENYPVEEIGIAFDIRHATVEGGLAWPIHFELMKKHLGIVYVKDFSWEGRRPKNVPLGKGQVDPRFFSILRKSGFGGPISLHVEYLHHGGVMKNAAALQNDLVTLKKLLIS